jgi:adenylate cyclase
MRLDPAAGDFYAYFIGSPLVALGRYQEGVPLLKRHLSTFPDNLWAHAMLAVAYVELGREQEAHGEAAEVMRINPQFSLASPATDVTKDPAKNKAFEAELRKAGLK